MIHPIPTPEEMQAAEKAVQIAQAEYDAADAAGLDTTEPLIELRSAIEACLDAQWRKDQAILKDIGVCSI